MVEYMIYLRGADQGISGTMKCADQLRLLARNMATGTGTMEISDNDGVAVVRLSDVSAVSWEESPDPVKAGFKKK